LKTAARLAENEKPDALPMNKVLPRLEEAATRLPDGTLEAAAAAFRRATERALDALAFDFAKDLRDTFAARGVEVDGRPPALLVGDLVLRIDIAARKAQWFYGQEPLTGRPPLSVAAYDTLFVELAARSGCPLATFDAAVLRAFPEIARRPRDLHGP